VSSHECDYSVAQKLLEEAIVVSRGVNLRATSQALLELGWIKWWQEDYARARALHTEAVEAFRSFGDDLGAGEALLGLATMEAREGNVAVAHAQLREAHAIVLASGSQRLGAVALEAAAAVALAFKRPLVASRLLSAAKHVLDAIGEVMGTAEKRRYAQLIADARGAANDDAAFDEAWQQGQLTSLDEAMLFARDALALQTADGPLDLDEHLDVGPTRA